MPSPQVAASQESAGKGQTQPASSLQLSEQPSFATTLPSSHSSFVFVSILPSPHLGSTGISHIVPQPPAPIGSGMGIDPPWPISPPDASLPPDAPAELAPPELGWSKEIFRPESEAPQDALSIPNAPNKAGPALESASQRNPARPVNMSRDKSQNSRISSI
jgi:hypothetical protein